MSKWNLPFIAILLVTFSAFAQNTGTGLPAFGSFTSDGLIDTTNNQNLNTHVLFPLLSVPGRAEGLSFAESYDSQLWQIEYSGSTKLWEPVSTSESGTPTWGWQALNSTGAILVSYSSYQCLEGYDEYDQPIYGNTTMYSGFGFVDIQGTPHWFPNSYYEESDCDGYNYSGPEYASDNTGYVFNAGSWIVTNPSGIELGGALTDTNGNQITSSVTSDSEGTHTSWSTTANQTVLADNYYFNDGGTWVKYDVYGGGDASGRVSYSKYTIKTQFNCPGIGEYSGTAWLPSAILTSNGTYTIDLLP